MLNSRVNFLVKIPIRCWDINKTRQGITFICRTLYCTFDAISSDGHLSGRLQNSIHCGQAKCQAAK